jgi:hypothetical protein
VTTTTTLGPLTVTEIDSYAPSLRLPVQSAITVTGTYGSFSVLSQAVYALTSTRPS